MPDDSKLTIKLGDYIEDAHAMETNVLQMLDSMIRTTKDKQIKRDLQLHKQQTKRHEERLRERLEKLGRAPSTRKEAQSMIGALVKGVGDQVRGDKAGKNARDGFVTEHMEIAAYELLERLAERAGDTRTATVARQNKREEEAMARKIAAKWDKFVDLSLAEDGIKAPKPRRRTTLRTRPTPRTRSRTASRSPR
jgi:ferritin-like metal-binding protein YciE